MHQVHHGCALLASDFRVIIYYSSGNVVPTMSSLGVQGEREA